jgi:hypothetical protein
MSAVHVVAGRSTNTAMVDTLETYYITIGFINWLTVEVMISAHLVGYSGLNLAGEGATSFARQFFGNGNGKSIYQPFSTRSLM